MKYFITLLISLFVINCSYSQTYPRLDTDSLGTKIVVMTLEQAQKLDNNMEILKLLEQAIIDCDNLSTSYLKVIDEQKRTIALLEVDVKLLKEQIKDKDKAISNLQERLDNALRLSDECEKQKSELNGKVSVLEEEVSRLKTKRNIGYGVGVLGLIGAVLLAIFK